MPELQEEVFPDPFHKRTGGGKVQMSQMREPKKAARFREFLFQNLQEELTPHRGESQIFSFHLPLRLGFAFRGWRSFFFLFLLLLLPLLLAACEEEEEETGGEPEKHFRIFEFHEKYIIRGIANMLKEKGYTDPKVDMEKGKVETDYITKGNLRAKVETTVKKLDRREREVVLVITTEKKTKEGWKATKMLDKAQYDRFFDEMEMQIYREMGKGD
jgi:hypothetical protein